MSMLSSALGLDKPTTPSDPALTAAAGTAGTNATTDRNNYLNILQNGQQSLNTSTAAAVSAGMPQFNQQMQSQKEQDVRRGVSTGDLGTSFEGDLSSAFQRNIANAAGSQAMNLFNTQAGAAGSLYQDDNNNYLSLLRGNQDYQTGQQNEQKQRSSALFGGLGSAVGGAFGGPVGASIGGALGSLF